MPKLEFDIDDIAKLAELLQRTGLTEIEIAQGDMKVRVARQVHTTIDVAAPALTTSMPQAGVALAPAGNAVDPTHPGLVTSPMVGTAYFAADPTAAPYSSVGQEVKEGATLLIIEAMKVMNQIRSPRTGRITKIFVQNAAPVEYGEPLLLIE